MDRISIELREGVVLLCSRNDYGVLDYATVSAGR